MTAGGIPKKVHDSCTLALCLAHTRTFPAPRAVLAFLQCSALGIASIAEKQGKRVWNQRQNMIAGAIIASTATATTTIAVVSATHSITNVC